MIDAVVLRGRFAAVMIVVSVRPTALSAAHGTETVIMSRADSRDHRNVPVWLPMAANAGPTARDGRS